MWKFLSTLPARGATRGGGLGRRIQQDFYPRSPRGERHRRAGGLGSLSYFYPRSPRGERPNALNHFGLRAEFLSTLPARGATVPPLHPETPADDFYPRSPRGERPTLRWLSALPLEISIHAPREGSDRRSTRKRVKSARNFYPRSPRGERRQR